MNAKKIMGAVLVALLAAALFVGAGAADDGNDYGPVMLYQNISGIPEGTWQNGAASVDVVKVVADGSVLKVVPGANYAPGTYTKGKDTLTVSNPTVSYSGLGTVNGIQYTVANNGIVYNGTTSTLVVAVNPANNTLLPASGSTTIADKLKYKVTYPNGSVLTLDTFPFENFNVAKNQTGTYKVQAIFNKTGFAPGVPFDILQDENVFTFTVVEEDDATISASVDTAFSGESVTITVKGTPGAKYYLYLTGVNATASAQLYDVDEDTAYSGPNGDKYTVTLENNGKAEVYGVVNSSWADDKNNAVIILTTTAGKKIENGELKIKISAPAITAKAEKDSYYIGDTVKISGTSTSEAALSFFIKGTNLELQGITLAGYSAGKTWEGKLDTAALQKTLGKKLDVGIYSIIIKQNGDEVATLSITLKQPFIQLVTAPEVVAQGTAAEFIGTAEATQKVYYYVFGTNFFTAAEVGASDFDENEFTFEIAKTTTANMSAGQYFVVIQHPMYDNLFNIAPNYTTATPAKLSGDIVLNSTGDATATEANKENTLFNVNQRQTANAAQALCDALDSQNIDDMYVKYSFFIVGEDESFSIAAIPTEVAQGETFTISGVSTANAGKFVTVEMVSTAFAAVPKETVGSAAFIAVTTQIADDGTWEVTMDTSNLNVDEYSLSVACSGQDKPWKNVNINVVEGAETPDTPDTPDVPDTPDTPDTPTEPETPGFGALAALAGLGAVAVLLLRRE